MPSAILTISYFSLCLVFITDEMESSKQATKQLKLSLVFMSNDFFWDGLCSNVLCPFLKDAEEEHFCSEHRCAPSRAALFQQETSQHHCAFPP